MRHVVSGLIAGYAMAIFFVGLTAWLLLRHRAFVIASLLPRFSLMGIAGLLPVIPFFGWAVVGMLFGLLYAAFEQARPGPGLRSPNLLYTAFVLATLAAFIWLLIPLRRIWQEIVVFVIAFAAIFGWLLPWLAA